ncbi:hypothetical protein BD309DRAFT_958130 [Dichomitus squalens]|nr:hypothetical protein BD309DRAFT_958130 [Dichomitus squalens]
MYHSRSSLPTSPRSPSPSPEHALRPPPSFSPPPHSSPPHLRIGRHSYEWRHAAACQIAGCRSRPAQW